MDLLDVIFIAKCLVKHLSNLLYQFKIMVCEDVRQVQHQLTVVADDSLEILLWLISHDLHEWCEHEAEKDVDHGHVWKPSAWSAEKSTTFVVVVLAGEGHLFNVQRIKLVGEIVDGVNLKIDKVLSIDGLEPELI